MIILRALRVILRAVMPLPLIEYPSQMFDMGDLFLGLPLNLLYSFFW
jgi:hypothetical protein